jgi:hypothetical protein
VQYNFATVIKYFHSQQFIAGTKPLKVPELSV